MEIQMKAFRIQILVAIIGLASLLPIQSQSAPVAKGYVVASVNKPYIANTNGYVVVKLVANPSYRSVLAQGVVDGESIAYGSAADNVGSVISTAMESFTFPVRQGSTWQVYSTSGSTGVEVRWFTYGIAL
jgi:hypothetical protein